MKVTLLPSYDRQNAWLQILEPLDDPLVLSGDIAVDYAVVGGGYGGLAVARRLAELDPNSSIALIEADRIGNNAAGRCSGFIIDHAHNIRAKGFAEDPERAKRTIALNRDAIAWLRQIVKRESIECDWRMEGKTHAAASERGVRFVERFRASLESIDEEFTMLGASELKRRFGTSFYQVGLHAPHTALVNPAALVVGLACTMPANVTVFEASPVTSVDYGPPHTLRTSEGSVLASVLIVAANGFGEGFGLFRNRLIPLITWASMTRARTEDEADRLGGDENYAIIPAHPAGTTVRRRPDGRILIRNQYTFSRRSNIHAGREKAAKIHRRSFEARYPMLSDVEFEYSWGGALSLSRNGSGVCGEVKPGVFATMVYQGTGMSKGTISGKLLAEQIMGRSDPRVELLTGDARPSRNIPGPFNRWGVMINSRWRRWQAGVEE